MFLNKSETFLCPGHKICVRNKCCASGQTGKHLCRQQCVRNNVSSFARAFRVDFRRSLVSTFHFISLACGPMGKMKQQGLEFSVFIDVI